jgi:hypothetical protein
MISAVEAGEPSVSCLGEGWQERRQNATGTRASE